MEFEGLLSSFLAALTADKFKYKRWILKFYDFGASFYFNKQIWKSFE